MDLVRREIKFQIPLDLVDPISQFVEKYCDLDKYSFLSPDYYYTINSLYLDSDKMMLLENKRSNLPKRFSMRIRSYGEDPKFPAFIETKRKVDHMINKKRAAITSWDTVRFIEEGICAPENPDIIHPFLRAPCYNIIRYGLRPKMMTQYRRKAYMGKFDTYSRVTFDRELKCYPEDQYNIFPRSEKFRSYDHAGQYKTSDLNIVLELKCEVKIPFWMTQLIRKFELNQSQFSKFDSSWTYLADATYDRKSFSTISALV